MRLRSLRAVSTLSVLALTVFLNGCGESGTGESGAAKAADPVVQTAEQLMTELQRVPGRPLLVNFWAQWCSPCLKEIPELLEVRDEFVAQGGEVIMVSMDMLAPKVTPEKVSRGLVLMREELLGSEIPCVVFGGEDPGAVIEMLNLPGELPATIAIDATGTVVKIHGGRASADEFRELAALARGGS